MGFGEATTKWFPDLDGAVLHVEKIALRYLKNQQLKWLQLHTTFARHQAQISRQIDFEPFLNVFLYDGPRAGCPWKYCTAMTIEKRAVLYSPDEPSTCLYLMHTGAVGLFSSLPQTDEDWKMPKCVVRHGWFLNVRALSGSPCQDCAIALEGGEVLSWNTEQWRLMGRQQPLMMSEVMRALLKQQAYDDDSDLKEVDNLHMDMDNHDWEAFSDRVDQHHTVASMSQQSFVHSATFGADITADPEQDDHVVHRVGDWSTHKARGAKDLSASPDCCSAMPEALKVHMPGLQTAQALGRLGFYTDMRSVSKEAPVQEDAIDCQLPQDLKEDLHTSFFTFSEQGKLSWASVGPALMYAGIFEEHSVTKKSFGMSEDGMTEEQFVDLGRDMLMAKLTPSNVQQCRQMFAKYDEDHSGSLDLSEMSTCFAERVHPNVSAEEVESLAEAWAHDGKGGAIDIDAFVAIVTRFVRKHKTDWHLLCAICDIIGAGDAGSKDMRITSDTLIKRAQSLNIELAADDALEMLWAASGSNHDGEMVEIQGINIGSFMSVIFMYLGKPKNKLPPPPRTVVRKRRGRPTSAKVATAVWHTLPPPEHEEVVDDFAEVETLKDGEGAVGEVDEAEKWAHAPHTCRARLHLLLEEPGSSTAALYIAVTMLVLISISVFVLVLEPLVSGQDKDAYSDTTKLVWTTIEIFLTVVFILEILARALVCNALGTRTFREWISDPRTLCDIVAVLPYFTDLVLDSAGDSFKLLRLIRLLRLGRVMRMGRISKMGHFSPNVIESLQPAAIIMVVIWAIYLKKT